MATAARQRRSRYRREAIRALPMSVPHAPLGSGTTQKVSTRVRTNSARLLRVSGCRAAGESSKSGSSVDRRGPSTAQRSPPVPAERADTPPMASQYRSSRAVQQESTGLLRSSYGDRLPLTHRGHEPATVRHVTFQRSFKRTVTSVVEGLHEIYGPRSGTTVHPPVKFGW